MKETSDFLLFHTPKNAARGAGIPSSGSTIRWAAFQSLLPLNPSPTASLGNLEGRGAKKHEDGKWRRRKCGYREQTSKRG